MSAPTQRDEYQRLEALARYDILDTLPEEAFDRLANLAARIFRTPIALVSLIDEERQWFKACLGLDLRQTDRSLSFCAHAILGEGVMVVPDATQDPRFVGNALVTGTPNIRFYAGAPLVTPDGHKLGTLCVIDDVPRPGLEADERANLTDLAALVVDELELRHAQKTLENEARAKSQMVSDLRRATEVAQLHVAMADLLEYDLDLPDLVPAVGELLSRSAQVQWVGLHVPAPEGGLTPYTWRGLGVTGAFVDLMGYMSAATSRSGLGGRREGEPLFLDHAELGGTHSLSPTLADTGVRSMAWFPLTTPGGSRGIITFARFSDDGAWQPGHQRLLKAAARTLGVALSRREQVRQLEALAFVDSLTGLGNRRALKRDLADRLAAQVGKGPGALPFTLVLVDLGGLQAINEAEGYERGDALLHLFGEALQTQVGGAGTVYRLSGDEFAVLTSTERGPARQIDAAVSLVRSAGFDVAQVQTGCARFPEDGTDARTLFTTAGTQLYGSSEAGAEKEARPRPAQEARARPAQEAPAGPLSSGALILQGDRVRAGNSAVKLTRHEAGLLAALMRHAGEVVSRDALTREVWGGAVSPSSNPVEVHIFNLRRKLRQLTDEVGVQTVRGQGYMLQTGGA